MVTTGVDEGSGGLAAAVPPSSPSLDRDYAGALTASDGAVTAGYDEYRRRLREEGHCRVAGPPPTMAVTAGGAGPGLVTVPAGTSSGELRELLAGSIGTRCKVTFEDADDDADGGGGAPGAAERAPYHVALSVRRELVWGRAHDDWDLLCDGAAGRRERGEWGDANAFSHASFSSAGGRPHAWAVRVHAARHAVTNFCVGVASRGFPVDRALHAPVPAPKGMPWHPDRPQPKAWVVCDGDGLPSFRDGDVLTFLLTYPPKEGEPAARPASTGPGVLQVWTRGLQIGRVSGVAEPVHAAVGTLGHGGYGADFVDCPPDHVPRGAVVY